MKMLLAIIAIIIVLVVLGILAACVVLISMGISSRKLWEYRNKLEKENKELKEG